MIKGRREIEKVIETEIMKIISDNDACKEIYTYVKDTYEIPRTITSDYISMRTSLSEASEFVLFCLFDAFEKLNEKVGTNLDKFFTMQEVKTYRNSKYEVGKIKFPLRFKVVQVKEDQWIGKIDIAMLMKLRAAQLINYNVNAQRTMQRIVKGDKEIYKIAIDHQNVNAIEELFRANTYIPTPFTLNIPQDTNFDFYYDEENCELVIKSLDHFDINDGYHRYIAACKINDLDHDFNYDMELRIVNFFDDKSKQFIYQEDQKTKMKKIDSNSLNMNKAANIVVTRLNESPQCNLQGLIGRNQGIINFGELAELVHYFYFKSATSKEKEKVATIAAIKELTDNFNMLTEYSSMYLEETYSFKKLVAIMCTFNYYKDGNNKNICKVIDKVVERVENLDNKKFYTKTPRKSMMNEIESIIKEVE